MKNIFRVFTLILLALFMVVGVTACDSSQKDQELLNSFLIEQDGKTLTSDFVLPAYLKIEEKGEEVVYDLVWSSNNGAIQLEQRKDDEGKVVDYLAKVTYPEEEAVVTLTVTLGKVSKEFTVRVSPIDVYNFSGTYVFPNDKQKVYADFDLDQECSFAGKKATITWSVDEAYQEFISISEDGKKCLVSPSSLDPEVKINATFTYKGESTTKKYKMTVSQQVTHEEVISNWYNNPDSPNNFSGWIVLVGTAYSEQYGNVSFYVLDEEENAGYYGYRVKVAAADADKIKVGAYVTVTGSTNTNYNGLMETNAGALAEFDVSKNLTAEQMAAKVKAIDEDILAGSPAAFFNQSRLVSLTSWKITKIGGADDKFLFEVEKEGITVQISTSKYFEGAYDSTKEDAMAPFKALQTTLAVGDYVNVKGILSRYIDKAKNPQDLDNLQKGICVYPLAASDVVKTEAEAEGTEHAGKLVAALMKQNAQVLPTDLVTAPQTVTLAAATDKVTVAYEVLGQSNALAINGNVLSINPAKAEVATIKLTYTCGSYVATELIKIKSQKVSDAEMVAQEAEKLMDFAADGSKELQLTGATYSTVAISWSLKEPVEGVSIENGKLVLAGGLDTTVTLVATVTCGEATVTKDINVTVKTPTISETGTWADPLSPATAIYLAGQLNAENKEISKDKYYIKGTISTDPTADYCNFDFIDGETHLVVYGLWTASGDKRYGTNRDIAELPVAKGDVVVLYGNLQNYSGKLEVVNARLIAKGETYFTEEDPQVLNAATALELAGRLNAEEKETSTHKYYVKATIATDPTADYCNFDFVEGETHLVVYGLWNYDGTKRFGSRRDIAELPVKNGDVVVLYGNFQNYNGKLELVNAWLMEINGESQIPAEPDTYTLVGAGTKENPYTAADAIYLAGKLNKDTNETSADKYYIQATIGTDPTANYCNFDFVEGETHLVVYGLWTVDGTKRYGTSRDIAELPVKKGDVVVLHANFQNYGGKLEAVNAWLISVNGVAQETSAVEPEDPAAYTYVGEGTAEKPYTPNDALHLAADFTQSKYNSSTKQNEYGTLQMVYVQGKVVDQGNDNGTYIQNFKLAVDGVEAQLVVYTCNETDEFKDIRLNDVVVIYGYLMNYNGTIEISNGKGAEDTDMVYPIFTAVTRGNNSVTVASTSSDKATVSEITPAEGVNESTFTFKVAPTEGYELVSVKVNGKVVEAIEGVYTGKISGPTSISVETQEEGAVTPVLAASVTMDSEHGTFDSGTKLQSFENEGLKVTNKTTADKLYTAPARFYSKSTITIEYTGMVKIVVHCNTADYATVLASGQGDNFVVDGKDVTIKLSDAVNSFTTAGLTAQVRVDSIDVYTLPAEQ